MRLSADEIAYLRWRELDVRRTNIDAAAYYFHVRREVAARWCELAWRSAHRGSEDRVEEGL